MKELRRYRPVGLVVAVSVMVVSWGCSPSHRARLEALFGRGGQPAPVGGPEGAAPGDVQVVPAPLNLMLPTKIRIHPFTGTRTFEDAGNIKGLDARVEALDAWGHTTKAFGDFRFELYSFMPNSTEPKAGRLVTWEVPLTDPGANFAHWSSINRAYEFKLQWKGIVAGQRYVLMAVFSSPYTKRLFAERVFVAGQ